MAGSLIGTRPVLAAAALVLGALAAAPAYASGTPYYGFSGYYGGPSTYYTHDTDIHQTTRLEDGSQAFGVRTYTAGGPFWRYQPRQRAGYHRVHRHRHARVIRVRG